MEDMNTDTWDEDRREQQRQMREEKWKRQ